MNKEDIDDLSPDLKDVLNYMQDPKTSLNLLEKLPIGVWQSCNSEEHGNYVVEELKYENNQYIFPILCKQMPDANLAEFIAVAHTALPYFIDKLVAVEKECDAERAHNAVLRQALEKYVELSEMATMAAQYGGKLEEKLRFGARRDAILGEMTAALDLTPSDSAAKVQKLVDVLEFILAHEYPAILTDKAQKALAEWRGE